MEACDAQPCAVIVVFMRLDFLSVSLYWFTSLAHARVIVEAWHREYNEERPKKSFGGLPPAAHTQRLMQNPLNKPSYIQSPVLLKTGAAAKQSTTAN